MIVGVVSMTAVWLVTWLGFGATWGDPLGVFVVIVAAVTAIAGISLLITGFARTENQADTLTTIVALLFAVAGGTFFLGATGAAERDAPVHAQRAGPVGVRGSVRRPGQRCWR